MGQERRRSPRAQVQLIAVITVRRTGKVRRVLTHNLSGVGVCFIDQELLPAGEALHVELILPDRKQPLPCDCTVVWSKIIDAPRKSYEAPRVETAIEITRIQPNDRRSLVQYSMMNATPSTQGE